MRILIYYNHQQDLGHLMRWKTILNAITNLSRHQAKIFIIQAGMKQKYLNLAEPENIFYIPEPFYSKSNIDKFPVISPGQIKKRVLSIESAINLTKPDIFITDFFPFGRMECKYELIPVLQSLYRKGVKICASVPLPYFTCPKLKLGEFIALSRLYDKILIHSPENLDLKYIARLIHLERRISKSDFLRVFTYLKKKIIYTGYVIRESFLKEDASLHKKPLITIHRGGGTTSPDIISSALQAAPLLSRKYQILCIAGPATDNQELKKFKNLMSSKKTVNPVILKKFVPDLCPYFRRSEICVGTGGSTVYELLYLKKKAIVIPYMGAPGRVRVDQLARAHILKDYAGAAIIDYQKLNSESLINEISRLNLDKKISHSVINKEWFRGAEVTARAILC